jgi:hypothetical protein
MENLKLKTQSMSVSTVGEEKTAIDILISLTNNSIKTTNT